MVNLLLRTKLIKSLLNPGSCFVVMHSFFVGSSFSKAPNLGGSSLTELRSLRPLHGEHNKTCLHAELQQGQLALCCASATTVLCPAGDKGCEAVRGGLGWG